MQLERNFFPISLNESMPRGHYPSCRVQEISRTVSTIGNICNSALLPNGKWRTFSLDEMIDGNQPADADV
jgi:hypothetical protein